MPAPFDGYGEPAARVASTCLVSVGPNRYSVSCEYAGQWVSSRLYPPRIEVVVEDALIASHWRLLDRDQLSYNWQHYIPLIERKPGAAQLSAFSGSASTVASVQTRPRRAISVATGSLRRFWPQCRSPSSMRCWWLLNWYWRVAA
jgi:hypothetical protein